MDINFDTIKIKEATNEESFFARELNKLQNDESISFECKCFFSREDNELRYSIQIDDDKIEKNVLIFPKTSDSFIFCESDGESLTVFLLKTKAEEKE